MHRVIGVSFPRSGHGPVYNILRHYFGEEMHYCDPLNRENEYCACRQLPCKNPKNTYSKNHDFDIANGEGLPIVEGQRYLIQYRSPVRSIASSFLLCRKINPASDNRRAWTGFSRNELRYWKLFIRKWVTGLPGHDVDSFHCRYEDLIESPREIAGRVLAFSTPEPIDEERLDRALARIKPRPLDHLKDFPFYDESFFLDLEARVKEEMEILNLPSFRELG